MQAIEFETLIGTQIIPIPLRYNYLSNKKAKIIILYTEEIVEPNYDKQALILAFQQANKFNAFANIKNSTNWQKQIRDEWE